MKQNVQAAILHVKVSGREVHCIAILLKAFIVIDIKPGASAMHLDAHFIHKNKTFLFL